MESPAGQGFVAPKRLAHPSQEGGCQPDFAGGDEIVPRVLERLLLD